MYYCRGIPVYEEDDIAEAIDTLYGEFAPTIIKNIMIYSCKSNKNLMKYFISISNMFSIFQFIEKYSIIDRIVEYFTTKYKYDTIYTIENAVIVPPISSIANANEEDVDNIIKIASIQKYIYIEGSSDSLLRKMEEFAGTRVNSMSIAIMPYYEPYSFMKVIDKIFRIF